ncbi:MAG: GGDEF domain-containing protein [Treponema sp.]|nr:GGDEF domain-containing protein [Treponema sp.]
MDSLYHIYYFQTNIFCILLTLIVLIGGFISAKRDGVDESVSRFLAAANILYCITDILASYFRGMPGLWVKYILYIVNIIYICIPLVFAFIFVEYSHYKLRGVSFFKTAKGKILLAPLIITFIIVLTTPISHFAFSIDTANLYKRSFGAYLLPIVSWLYYISTTIRLLVGIIKTGNYQERENLKPIAQFAIWPLIANILQVFFYGITVSQVGFTLSILIFYVSRLRNQILNDELTDLKNRRDFNIYINNFIRNSNNHEIYLCMIDINQFKTINDKFGIPEGDLVLRTIGQIISETCDQIDRNIFVCRFGGDEFVLVNKNNNQLEIDTLKLTIRDNIQKENLKQMKDYDYEVSLGSAYGIIDSITDFNELLERAKDDLKKDKLRIKHDKEELETN